MIKLLIYLILISSKLDASAGFATTSMVRHPSLLGKSWLTNFPSPLLSSQAGNDALLTSEKKKKKKSHLVTIWIHVVSIFIIGNYRSTCWPGFLTRIPLPMWSLIHAVSGMLFAGTIITTTILEWIVTASRKKSVNEFWFQQAPRMEKMMVLPALTGSIISGVAQAFCTYDSLRFAPRHVKSSLHLLFLFGLWWGVTDRRTQGKAQDAVMSLDNDEGGEGELPVVMQQRRVSNAVSCCFLAALYAVMVLKPGYTPAV